MTIDRQPDRREGNRRVSHRQFADGLTVLTAKPRFLIVELTRKCNLSCAMCRPAGVAHHGEDMSEALFSRLEAELFPTADVIDLRGWGESLILPHFPDRLKRASRFGAKTRVVTNLSFRRPAVLDALIEVGTYVGVSLDSADQTVLSRLRSGANLSQIRSNLLHLTAGYRRQGFSERICLYVTCQAPSVAVLPDVIALASECGVEDVRLAPVSVPATSSLSLEQMSADLTAALAAVEHAAQVTGVRVSLTASLIDQGFACADSAPCIHPWTYCYITFDGRVGFCDHLIGPEGDRFTLGNLSDSSFDEIWNCPAWVALRSNHVSDRDSSHPYFDECSWCYRNRMPDTEPLLDAP